MAAKGAYTAVMPDDWRLQTSAVEPQEVDGPIGKMLKSTGAAFKKLDGSLRKEADRRLVASLRFLLKKIGATVLTALHDSAMPKAVHNAIDGIFLSVWPEVEKGILDGLVLDLGFQFDKYREKVLSHEAEAPEELLPWMRATLLYAMMPYDLSFFGMVRQPLLFAINLVFLFPLYGVDSVTIIALWAVTYTYDEYQLTSFIVRSKGLAFITAGLLTGVLGFVKLYSCAIVRDPDSPKACQYKAPGVYSTYEWDSRWEFWLFQLRTVLVWVTFLRLYLLEPRLARKRRHDAYQAQLAAHPAAARRGLPPAPLAVALRLAGGAGLVALGVVYVVGDYRAHTGVLPLLADELRKAADLLSGAPAPVATGSLVALLALLAALLPAAHLLAHRQLSAAPAAGALLACGALCALFYPAFAAGGAWLSFAAGALLLSAGGLAASTLLLLLQLGAKCRDKDDRAALETILRELGDDGEGNVSKDEFKKTYRRIFPKYTHSFDSLWARLDANGDGVLSREELADALGLGHLRPDHSDEPGGVDTPSEALARQLAVAEGATVDAKLAALRVALHVDSHRLKQWHLRAGGVMRYFFFYDLLSVLGLAAFVFLSMDAQDIYRGDWRYNTSLYFTKMAMGLLSAPFLVFKVPVIEVWLTHARPTAYDKAGTCCAKLPGDAISKRFADSQAAEREARLERLAEGKPTLTDRWQLLVGTYSDENERSEAGRDPDEVAAEAAQKRREQEAKHKLLSEEDKQLEDMKREAKRAFEKKQRAVMENRKPEASLLVVRRDEATGQLRLAGGEATELL